MAVIESVLGARLPFAARLSAIVATVKAAIAQNKVYRRTYFELDALSDRELNDIGLGRGDLHDVATKTAMMHIR